MNEILIGRQQILDCDQNVYAYEILFRGNDFDLNHKDGATSATNQVITDTLVEIGLNTIVGPAKAFINFTTQNLLEKTPLHLPKDRVVIEVLESVNVDLRTISALKEFSGQGYTIALDDFVLDPQWLPLLEFADIIKLDVMAMPLSATLELIEQIRPYNLTLLAEKVETEEEFIALKQAGCTLFQGFFFSKPNIVAGKRLGINQAAAIRLLTTVNKTDVSFKELSDIISQDVSLSFKLLHYINSAFFALPNKIESMSHAVTYLGLAEIKRWVNILTLTSLTDRPDALLQQFLVRGKMCELLADQFDVDSGHMFLIGMFSSLDSLLNIPIKEALQQLPLAEDFESAIINREGISGKILSYVIAYERWEVSSQDLTQLQPENIGTIYIQSIDWTNKVLGIIS